MFDPGILLSLEAVMPPQMLQPPIVAEGPMWQSPIGKKAMEMGDQFAAAYEKQIDGWLAQINAVKASVANVIPSDMATAEQTAMLDKYISDFEACAEKRAVLGARLEKQVKRDVKQWFRTDPSIGASVRATGVRFIACEKRIVDALLNYSLFLRALRTEGMVDSRGGPVFDDPDDLEKYLDGIIAA